ncbi:uncharacterized protein At4g08330, chloroplastic-like isoform X1 [Ipomoea triloba]|uniref:uncharacterized protein At4g08330, chloroplastic-like isoform X1 n=1 Tax=Ipomoea triloba TaxID=35885 RepID=UPI00125E4E19|nr:uncharacterized protein At4g08330, chloroplastic-like isoform X1 [Ipomoea triloba]
MYAYMETPKGHHLDFQKNPSFASSSLRDVTYSHFCSNSCGCCGYELNLCSSSRNTSTIGSKYNKCIKKGIISFLYIDESRFTQVKEVRCMPYFVSKHSWGFFPRRTKLLCRKCGNHVGTAYDNDVAYPLVADELDSTIPDETATHRRYDIKIRSLQPSSEDPRTPAVI